MYKLTKNDMTGIEDGVQRLSDNAFIRIGDDNPHYLEYLKWLSEGNEPLPADEPTQGETV